MPDLEFKSYIEFMEFISQMIGIDAELVLYDVEQSIVHHVINPLDEEMKPGSEMRRLEKSFIEKKNYEKEMFIVNYRALSKSQKKLKSGTMFLKDKNEKLKAILTINIPVDHIIELRDMLNQLISGPEKRINTTSESEFYDSFEVSVEDMVVKTINDEISKYGFEAVRLSNDEKLEIIKNLDNKGIFLVKGAINELAKAFNTTETTIYRYINKLAKIK